MVKERQKGIVTIPSITVEQLFEDLKEELRLKLMTPGVKLDRRIRSSEIHRPGLAFSGFYVYFAFDRVQVLGKTEVAFLAHLHGGQWNENLNKFFSFRIPCLIIAKNQNVHGDFLKRAEKAGVPVFKSALKTSSVVSRVTVYVENVKAPETVVHGTLLDVYGVGTILIGKSGIGKSECALELIERGHRLVADDGVRIRFLSGQILMGYASDVIRHSMEIRGLGIIDVERMFGAGAVRNQKRIGLVVTLEKWERRREYDRLGLNERRYKILGTEVPHLIIPVKPGRNIPILIESAALSQRTKTMGWHAPEELNNRVMASMEGKRSILEHD